MTEHILKSWPVYFDAVKSGEKTFEVRRDDRGFQKGDVVVLRRTCENDVHKIDYAYHEMRFKIGWILTGGQFGLKPCYVAMSLKPIDADGGS